MIDFRYHLVSLISVFLALAVGIVLGAGPLRDVISDQLTGQVEVLREEKDALQFEIDDNRQTIADDTAFIEATAPAVLEDALPGYRVAVVTAPGVAADVTAAVAARLEESGAEITARAELTDAWAAVDDADTRSAVADEVRAATGLSGSAEVEQVLGTALGLALTDASTDDPRAFSEDATTVIDELAAGGQPLLREDGTLAPADLVLVLTAPREEPAPDATPDPDLEEVSATWAVSLAALAVQSPTVVAGYAQIDTDLLVRVRGERIITTVDGLGSVAGQVTVPLALAAVVAEEEASPYGFGIGAQQPLPPLQELDGPAALEPTAPPTAPSTGTEGADDAGTEGTDGTGGTEGADATGTDDTTDPDAEATP